MKVKIPTQCPSCDSKLDRVKDQLFCRNPSCKAVSRKRVLNFIKKTKIKWLGEKTVDKLNIQDIADIYDLTVDYMAPIIGVTTAKKILVEIEKAKTMDVAVFLSAFSIPLIGRTAASKIKTTVLESLSLEDLKEYGLGEKAAANLLHWITYELEYAYSLPIKLYYTEEKKPKQTTNLVVCISGKIKGYTKAKLSAELKNAGVSVVGSVTKKVTHLISEERKGTSKEVKALEYGVPIVSYEEFKEILNNVKK